MQDFSATNRISPRFRVHAAAQNFSEAPTQSQVVIQQPSNVAFHSS
jgi:hypothetical protein